MTSSTRNHPEGKKVGRFGTYHGNGYVHLLHHLAQFRLQRGHARHALQMQETMVESLMPLGDSTTTCPVPAPPLA